MLITAASAELGSVRRVITSSTTLGRARSERGELVLTKRSDGHLELRANGVFVMDTENTHTERELARVALARASRVGEVLIGGLGLGFTAAEVLADPRVRRATVAEIEPALIEWMRSGVIPHGPELLTDPRLQTEAIDIRDAFDRNHTYDLVLLDVDNGPGYLVHDANAEIYATPFLARVHEALNPGGAVVIWSASREPKLLQEMQQVFGTATEHSYDVQLGARPETYFLYLSQT